MAVVINLAERRREPEPEPAIRRVPIPAAVAIAVVGAGACWAIVGVSIWAAWIAAWGGVK